MPDVLYVLVGFVTLFIEVITIAMSIRAILSWFYDGDGPFIRFLYAITEPAIMPIRMLLAKMNWLQDTPMDFSYILTYVALFLIQAFLTLLI